MTLAIDLFCGLGGWTEPLLDLGYDVVGFDIERHEYGDERYPGQLVIQDVRTLRGSQFKDADLIVASPPCQEYSWMAMPWSRAKQVARALRGEDEFPENYKGSRSIDALNELFLACFRIQADASAAAGRHVPMVVENVRGAQPWVGRARWNFGSYYLWGDVPALMPPVVRSGVKRGGFSWSDYGKDDYVPKAFNGGVGREDAVKMPSQDGGRRTDIGKGARFKSRSCGEEAIKQGGDWFNSEHPSISRMTSSKSPARKAASAMIAKIPYPLAWHIGQVYLRQ